MKDELEYLPEISYFNWRDGKTVDKDYFLIGLRGLSVIVFLGLWSTNQNETFAVYSS